MERTATLRCSTDLTESLPAVWMFLELSLWTEGLAHVSGWKEHSLSCYAHAECSLMC